MEAVTTSSSAPARPTTTGPLPSGGGRGVPLGGGGLSWAVGLCRGAELCGAVGLSWAVGVPWG